MTCDRRLASYYRDGALPLEERYEFESHLRECDDCTAHLRSQMRLAQVVRSLPMEPTPPTLRTAVYQEIAERQARRREPVRLGALGRTLAPAAVAAAVAVSALVTFRPGGLDLAGQPSVAPAALSTVSAPAQSSAAVEPSSGPAVVSASAPAPAQTQSSGTVAQAPSGVDGSLAGKPPVHVPVTDSNPGNLPVQLANPAAVPAPIARLYRTNQQVRDMLGEASPGSRTVTLLEQSFQGGLAIWRSDTRQIYVLHREGNTWTVYSDTWRPGERVAVEGAPPPGAMVPTGGFGTVWRNTPEVKSRLGWAVYEPRGSGGSIQSFENGLIVWTPHGLLYVLSNDGTWRTFPDASPL